MEKRGLTTSFSFSSCLTKTTLLWIKRYLCFIYFILFFLERFTGLFVLLQHPYIFYICVYLTFIECFIDGSECTEGFHSQPGSVGRLLNSTVQSVPGLWLVGFMGVFRDFRFWPCAFSCIRADVFRRRDTMQQGAVSFQYDDVRAFIHLFLCTFCLSSEHLYIKTYVCAVTQEFLLRRSNQVIYLSSI